MDEYADLNPRLILEIIRPVLVERNGGAFWIGTPRGYNHFWEMFDAAKRSNEAGKPDWYGIETSRISLRTCVFDAEKTGPGLDALRQYRHFFDPARRHFSDEPLHAGTSHAADASRISATAETDVGRPNLRKVAKTGRSETGEHAIVDEYEIFD